MRYRLEILIPLLFLGYVAFFPSLSGELQEHFFKLHILLPYILVLIALIVQAFGISQLCELIKSLKVFFINQPEISNLKVMTVKGAISFSYVSATLWVLYILVLSSAYSFKLNELIPEIALAFTYAFIVAEIILRPLSKRLEFLNID